MRGVALLQFQPFQVTSHVIVAADSEGTNKGGRSPSFIRHAPLNFVVSSNLDKAKDFGNFCVSLIY